MGIGRIIAAVTGIVLIAFACALTIWTTLTSKDMSSVGVSGMFVVGLLLTLAGLFDLKPSSLEFGKDGINLQLVAEAVKHVKDSAQEEASKVAADPEVKEAVVGAKTDGDAQRVAADISRRILHAMPATADLTRKAISSLR
jgi:hypothetical protein